MPGEGKTKVGCGLVESRTPLRSKSQDQEVGNPLEVSVRRTVSPARGDAGAKAKCAAGARGLRTKFAPMATGPSTAIVVTGALGLPTTPPPVVQLAKDQPSAGIAARETVVPSRKPPRQFEGTSARAVPPFEGLATMESEWQSEEPAARPRALAADGTMARRNAKAGTSHTALVRIRAPTHGMSSKSGRIMSAAGAEAAQVVTRYHSVANGARPPSIGFPSWMSPEPLGGLSGSVPCL